MQISFQNLAVICKSDVKKIGEPENDDPSLALLVQHLRSSGNISLKTVSGHTEFQFVLHNAAIFRRMGCHNLALALVREWSFIKPDIQPLQDAGPGKAMTSHVPDEPAVEDLFSMGSNTQQTTPAKPARVDASQGNAEFDMGAFF